ncbi:MAG: hypothetical protein HOV97_05750 [Nonomuraea sp.]|nr:hypothetical protein [Nonomuraea sp.]
MKNTHTFLVHVTGCDKEQAEQVMAERLNHDEDLGFPYVLQYEPVIGMPLHMVTTADAEAVVRRPLVAGEASSIRKTLEVALQEEWAAAITEQDNPISTELRASGIIVGHTIREYGLEEWLAITKVDSHGDTMLLAGVDIDDGEHEFTLDIDEVVELLTTEA